MAEWHVNLQGDDFDLVELAARFASHDPFIQREDTAYYLLADELNTLEDPCDVLTAAEGILLPLNGLAKLLLNTRRPLTVGSLYRIDGNGKNRHDLLSEAGSLIEGAAPLKPGSDETNETMQQHDTMHAQLSLARRYEQVKQALSLFAKATQTWKDFYPIFEIMQSDLGGEAALVDTGWTTRNHVTRFTRTVNSPAASGETSRHRVPKGATPQRPMTASEGKEFITSLMIKWMESKLTPP